MRTSDIIIVGNFKCVAELHLPAERPKGRRFQMYALPDLVRY